MSDPVVEENVTEGLPDCGEDLRQVEFLIKLGVRLSAENIVAGMGESAPRDAYDLIIGLEKEVGWWALTILLGRYFEGQMAIARQHCPDMFEKTNDELLKELEECE